MYVYCALWHFDLSANQHPGNSLLRRAAILLLLQLPAVKSQPKPLHLVLRNKLCQWSGYGPGDPCESAHSAKHS